MVSDRLLFLGRLRQSLKDEEFDGAFEASFSVERDH